MYTAHRPGQASLSLQTLKLLLPGLGRALSQVTEKNTGSRDIDVTISVTSYVTIRDSDLVMTGLDSGNREILAKSIQCVQLSHELYAPCPT